MQQPVATLLITRPEPSGAAFAQSVLTALGPLERSVGVILSPVMTIEPVSFVLDALPSGLILTSVNGVEAARLAGLPGDLIAWCVGNSTAQAAAAAGFRPISAQGDSSALIRTILSHRPAGPLLHVHGAHVTGDVVSELSRAGVPCFGRVGYRQVSCGLSANAATVLRDARPVVVPLFSARSVSILAKSGPFSAPITVVAISAVVARAAESLVPVRRITAETPDAAAMCNAICTVVETISLATGP